MDEFFSLCKDNHPIKDVKSSSLACQILIAERLSIEVDSKSLHSTLNQLVNCNSMYGSICMFTNSRQDIITLGVMFRDHGNHATSLIESAICNLMKLYKSDASSAFHEHIIESFALTVRHCQRLDETTVKECHKFIKSHIPEGTWKVNLYS
jgi:hypothetical protein